MFLLAEVFKDVIKSYYEKGNWGFYERAFQTNEFDVNLSTTVIEQSVNLDATPTIDVTKPGEENNDEEKKKENIKGDGQYTLMHYACASGDWDIFSFICK